MAEIQPSAPDTSVPFSFRHGRTREQIRSLIGPRPSYPAPSFDDSAGSDASTMLHEPVSRAESEVDKLAAHLESGSAERTDDRSRLSTATSDRGRSTSDPDDSVFHPDPTTKREKVIGGMIRLPAVSGEAQAVFRSRVNSRVLIRGGRVVNAVDAFEQLSADHRMTLMFAVKDGVLNQDESLEAAAAIASAQNVNDNGLVDRLIKDIQTATASKKLDERRASISQQQQQQAEMKQRQPEGEVIDTKDMALLDNVQRMVVQRAVAAGQLSIAEALNHVKHYIDIQKRQRQEQIDAQAEAEAEVVLRSKSKRTSTEKAHESQVVEKKSGFGLFKKTRSSSSKSVPDRTSTIDSSGEDEESILPTHSATLTAHPRLSQDLSVLSQHDMPPASPASPTSPTSVTSPTSATFLLDSEPPVKRSSFSRPPPPPPPKRQVQSQTSPNNAQPAEIRQNSVPAPEEDTPETIQRHPTMRLPLDVLLHQDYDPVARPRHDTAREPINLMRPTSQGTADTTIVILDESASSHADEVDSVV